MASSLTISTGALTSALTSQNDTAVQNVLLNFATAIGIPEVATPQQKLDGVVAHLTEYMQKAAQERYFQTASAAARAEAQNNVHW